MKKLIVLMAFATSGLRCNAQIVDEAGQTHVIMTNGTRISSSLDRNCKVLNIEVCHNDDYVEVMVVDHGVILDSDDTIFEDDTIRLPLSEYQSREVHLYARTRNEIQYMGSVKTESK